ncbi:MAG: class I SAM-dependent methyltransferase [Pseudomonadota bacterium]
MAEDKKDEGHFSAAYGLDTAQATLEHYRHWAATYDKEVGEEKAYAQPARATEMLARYVLDKEAAILDAGCGSGLSGIALRKAGYRNLTGCDFSPEMLAVAREKQVYKTLFQADLNAGFSDTATIYDAITCVGVFSFGHVDPDACDHLLGVLATGGWLIIALNDPFWQKGSLERKLQELQAADAITLHAKEYGEHLPGANVMGWVLAVEKC